MLVEKRRNICACKTELCYDFNIYEKKRKKIIRNIKQNSIGRMENRNKNDAENGKDFF